MAKKRSDKFNTIYESKVKLKDAFEWRIVLEKNKENGNLQTYLNFNNLNN